MSGSSIFAAHLRNKVWEAYHVLKVVNISNEHYKIVELSLCYFNSAKNRRPRVNGIGSGSSPEPNQHKSLH